MSEFYKGNRQLLVNQPVAWTTTCPDFPLYAGGSLTKQEVLSMLSAYRMGRYQNGILANLTNNKEFNLSNNYGHITYVDNIGFAENLSLDNIKDKLLTQVCLFLAGIASAEYTVPNQKLPILFMSRIER